MRLALDQARVRLRAVVDLDSEQPIDATLLPHYLEQLRGAFSLGLEVFDALVNLLKWDRLAYLPMG